MAMGGIAGVRHGHQGQQARSEGGDEGAFHEGGFLSVSLK